MLCTSTWYISATFCCFLHRSPLTSMKSHPAPLMVTSVPSHMVICHSRWFFLPWLIVSHVLFSERSLRQESVQQLHLPGARRVWSLGWFFLAAFLDLKQKPMFFSCPLSWFYFFVYNMSVVSFVSQFLTDSSKYWCKCNRAQGIQLHKWIFCGSWINEGKKVDFASQHAPWKHRLKPLWSLAWIMLNWN